MYHIRFADQVEILLRLHFPDVVSKFPNELSCNCFRRAVTRYERVRGVCEFADKVRCSLSSVVAVARWRMR